MNNIALITGASKRIGKSIAEHLAENGWDVIIHYNHSAAEAEQLIEELTGKYPGSKFGTLKADLSEIEQVLGLISVAVSQFGHLDLLVNNASVFERGYLNETSNELFDGQFNVNLKAPFFLMRDFANYCKEGNIINFVDTRITKNKSDFAAYSLSKKGLWELTKMAALEFAPKIRVNAIAPGVTLAPADEDEDYLKNLAMQTPMQKASGIKPILKSVDYILENTHLTGQLLFADGGENLGKNL